MKLYEIHTPSVDATTQAALDKLADIPDWEDEDQSIDIDSIFPNSYVAGAQVAVPRNAYHPANLNPADIAGSQEVVKRAAVQYNITNKVSAEGITVILLPEHGYVAQDGHHRLAALILQGVPSVSVQLAEALEAHFDDEVGGFEVTKWKV